MWVHSLDGSQFQGGSHAVLVLGDDPEHVVLALHDTYTLALGGGRLHGLPPCVHLSIPSLYDEANDVTSTIVIRVVPVQEDHLASDDHRLQVCDWARDICKGNYQSMMNIWTIPTTYPRDSYQYSNVVILML